MNKTYLAAYLTLCKPRVVLLMLVTAWVGMVLAIPNEVSVQAWPWLSIVSGTLGIALMASCGAVINHLVDRRLDARMARTLKRPLPLGQLTPKQACCFAWALGIAGLLTLVLWVNLLTAVLTFMSLVGYAGIYTVFLKPATPQNIVIGGLAGAMPPLLGWTAITASVHADALLLVLIIFTWTPPHFWALAIYRYRDYAKTAIPMLPVVQGIPFTKVYIVLYTVLMIVATWLPFASGMNGLPYLVSTSIINSGFLYYVVRLYFSDKPYWAMRVFRYSIVYLFLLFGCMVADHFFYYLPP